MDKFTIHKGTVALLDTANVDTDQIIAKQFLKSIKRTGFGDQLFYDWRYNEDGSPKEDFSLNAPEFKGASILVARNNFGCGSSREHAVWAVKQYGFLVIIAPSATQEDGSTIPGFADIFRNNCGKNGVLTIQFTEEEVQNLFDKIEASKGSQATVDLAAQTITFHTPEEFSMNFDVDPALKDRLLKGADDIAITLENEADITTFETTHNAQL